MPRSPFVMLRAWLASLLSRDVSVSRSRAMIEPMTDRPEPRASLARGAQVSGYVVEERIGLGGFGEVFRARQPLIGREVAIKVLHAQYSDDPDAVARFVAEARAVNQISHAGIVEIFDFGRLDDGREFCIMELLVGRTLRDLLRERGRLPLAEALPILRGIAEAVDAAHAADIAHRDLKPDNVFVLADGRTKLIDFGLAKLTREHDSPVTQTGSVFGTPLYMSPEQCRGGALDTRTDLYSFGVVAYHVLVGEPPFSGDPIELALHHVNDRAEAPSRRCEGLPRYVDHVLLSLLAKDPTDRPPSLATAVAALEGSITLRRMRARHVRQLAATAVVVGGLGFGAFELATRTTADPDGCAPASERLRGIWDPEVVAAIDARFANSPPPGTAASWRSDRAQLGAFAARWAGQWDAACHAPDRTSDPLLYAQRSTCLENTLLGLHGLILSLTTMDLAHYESFDSGFVSYDSRTIADCESAAVLRAQVAAPPPSVRERVKELLLDTYKVSADASFGATERKATTVDVKVDRLDAIARELEAIYPPAAASPILARAGVLANVTWDVAARQPRAREAIADAIRRIAATRDDVMLADAYLLEATFELDDERDGDPVARAAAALELAAQAIARAGGPREPSASLAYQRARLASDRGEAEAAVVAYRAAMAEDREGVLGSWPHSALARALALAGRDADARTEAETMIATRVRAATATRTRAPLKPSKSSPWCSRWRAISTAPCCTRRSTTRSRRSSEHRGFRACGSARGKPISPCASAGSRMRTCSPRPMRSPIAAPRRRGRAAMASPPRAARATSRCSRARPSSTPGPARIKRSSPPRSSRSRAAMTRRWRRSRDKSRRAAATASAATGCAPRAGSRSSPTRRRTPARRSTISSPRSSASTAATAPPPRPPASCSRASAAGTTRSSSSRPRARSRTCGSATPTSSSSIRGSASRGCATETAPALGAASRRRSMPCRSGTTAPTASRT